MHFGMNSWETVTGILPDESLNISRKLEDPERNPQKNLVWNIDGRTQKQSLRESMMASMEECLMETLKKFQKKSRLTPRETQKKISEGIAGEINVEILKKPLSVKKKTGRNPIKKIWEKSMKLSWEVSLKACRKKKSREIKYVQLVQPIRAAKYTDQINCKKFCLLCLSTSRSIALPSAWFTFQLPTSGMGRDFHAALCSDFEAPKSSTKNKCTHFASLLDAI